MNLKGLLTIIMVSIFAFSIKAQSFSGLTDSELEAKKKEAIAAENYELANQIKNEQNTRKSLDDKLKEKQEELKTALANEDYEKAEQLKSEITQLEADIVKLKKLEEDKKIAIFQERYNDVISIENQISNLKLGKNEPPTQVLNSNSIIPAYANNTSSPTTPTNTFNRKTINKERAASIKNDLLEKPYNTKIIGGFNAGFGSDSYGDPIIAYHFSNSRWWVNKFLSGGTYFNFAFPEEGTIDGGAHMIGFADFDSPILPYASFGFGMGIDVGTGEFYTPAIFRVGSNVFFNKHRSIGLSIEFMQYFNNENIPKLRFGLVWTRMKRKHNTWIQNKK